MKKINKASLTVRCIRILENRHDKHTLDWHDYNLLVRLFKRSLFYLTAALNSNKRLLSRM